MVTFNFTKKVTTAINKKINLLIFEHKGTNIPIPKTPFPQLCLHLTENQKLISINKHHPYSLSLSFVDKYSTGQMKLFDIQYNLKLFRFCNTDSLNFTINAERTLILTQPILNLYNPINIANLHVGTYMIEIGVEINSTFCNKALSCPYLEDSSLDSNKFLCRKCFT